MRRTFVHLVAVAMALATGRARADDEVRVTAEKAAIARGSRDATAASSVVREDDLARAGSSVGDALKTQPGIEATSSGSTADLTTALVRGATSAELPVYLAGVRINDDLTGSTDLSTVPAWMLRRVEIYRGNAPVEADRLGIGGAIFLDPKLPRGPMLGATAGIGSFGYRSYGAIGGAGDREARALVAIRREDAENGYPYRDDRGLALAGGPSAVVTRRNADSHATDGWAIARLDGAGARVTTIVNAFTREQGIPGDLIAPSLAARMRTTRALVAVRGEIDCGESCALSVATSAMRAATVLYPDGDSAPSQEIRGERVEPSARLRISPIDGVELVTAADASRETLAVDPPSIVARARRDVLRVAGQASIDPTSWLLVAVLADVEANHTTADGAAAIDVAPLAARASARVGDERLAAIANVGRYARVPTLGELYGQSALLVGNADLRPERGITADVGARARRDFSLADRPSLVELDAFAFARRADDLVAYERTSFGRAKPYNVGSARIAGAEIALALQLARRVRVDESVTMQDPRDVTAGRTLVNDVLPLRSRLVDATGATLLLGDLARLDRLDVGARVLYVASRYADPAGLVVIPAQTTLDLDVATGFRVTAADLVVRGRVANVLDAARFDLVGYPQPGRAFYATIELVTR